MFVELIEQLRCPRAHEETHLVASATRSEARHVVDGVLGCPWCNAEFSIENGVLRIGEPERITTDTPPDAAVAMRLAAFMDLTESRGFALLCGAFGAQADLIHRLSDILLVLVNPPALVPPDAAAAVVLTRSIIPFATGSARAAALAPGTTATLVESAARAVRVGGRVVGARDLDVPPGVTELTRDEHLWIAEKNAAPHDGTPLVSITKASR